MKMFSISFEPELQVKGSSVKGAIVLGPVKEYFVTTLGYWTPDDYHKQWIEAISRVAYGEGKAASITDIPSPFPPGYVNWWPM